MSSPWTGPRARHRLAVAGLILLASVAVFAVVMRRAESEFGGEAAPQTEAYALLEVRPAEGTTVGFPAGAIDAARGVPHVVAVRPYLVGHVEAGNAPALPVVGVDAAAPLRLPGGAKPRPCGSSRDGRSGRTTRRGPWPSWDRTTPRPARPSTATRSRG